MSYGPISHCVCLTMCGLLSLQPQHPAPITLNGHWTVVGIPSSDQFRSPALGSDIEITVTNETVRLAYSLNRNWTLRLNGTKLTREFRQPHGKTFEDVAFVRVQDDGITLVTSRNRGGVMSREERVLKIVGDKLIVDGRRWVDGELIGTSKLTYVRR